MKQRNWYTIFLLSTCIVAGMIYIAGVYAGQHEDRTGGTAVCV